MRRRKADELPPGDHYLTGAEAAEFLGVKVASLYAYVSRGMIESVKQGKSRERAYRLSDLINLRNAVRGFHKSDVPDSWMGPVIKSAITDITPGGPTYRGRLCTELALSDTAYEQVAEILWETDQDGGLWAATPTLISVEHLKSTLPNMVSFLDLLKFVVLLMEASSPASIPLSSERTFADARGLILSLAASLGSFDGTISRQDAHAPRKSPVRGRGRPARSSEEDSKVTASVLLEALSGKYSKEQTALVNRALILCADHELNASTLAARIAASCGASMPSCVLSALGCFTGPLHGSASLNVEEMILGSMRTTNVSHWLREFLKGNRQIPGFGLDLYPDGDPRAKVLLDSVREMSMNGTELERLFELIDCVSEVVGEMPNIDTGLAAVRFALGLPSGSGIAIFAVGRAAGWIAHAVEQYRFGGRIRPRARYIGIQPAL